MAVVTRLVYLVDLFVGLWRERARSAGKADVSIDWRYVRRQLRRL